MPMEDNGKVDSNINHKSICCERIPELFLDKLVAKQHFSKFGKITRFILRPKRLSCTVEYETVDDAQNAYEHAGNFNGHAFTINFAEREVAHVQAVEEWIDPDVQAELQAMNPWASRTSIPSRIFQPASLLSMRDTRPLLPVPSMRDTRPLLPLPVASMRDTRPLLPLPVASMRDTRPLLPLPVASMRDTRPLLPLPVASMRDTRPLLPLPLPSARDPRLAARNPKPPATLQFPTPSLKSTKVTSTEVGSLDAAVRNELEAILRRPALTNEEKYRVLDARDKLIRLTTVRQTNIKTAVSTKGTCPDMCPEKERLMREFQRQVASFEMPDDSETEAASGISHRRAIKEYSRSSADQEVPLSHELRPESVLNRTMLYLMHYIMDLCDDPEVSPGDWFHFVWDRTRSIRKDITQQELCSLRAVQLVEQCARFHIHCAARLVAEDPSVFDKKINAENLTKCLQSLKYMYHDLRIKNIPCSHEAEFRSYIVLLNLGDSNFLWELKHLPEHIQNSVDIKRAISFYNALQNNNYVRFFNMVRAPETSYLSACILLGYFNKLRLRAMDTIIKAHQWRKTDGLPLAYLTRVLGFDDEEAAADFLQYHGLQCDSERVTLERLKKTDSEYTMSRVMGLVESKRTVSVGECVCGHALDSRAILEQHQPHNSFDAAGLLKLEAWTADDQLRGDAAVVKAAERRQEQHEINMQAPPAPLTSPPTILTDSSIFKVPQASPSLSPKQQQQQQQKWVALMPAATIFDGSEPFEGAKEAQTSPAHNANSGGSIFDMASNAPKVQEANSAAGESLFKMPFGAELNMSGKSMGSIFQTSEEPSPALPALKSSSIFDASAKETEGLFAASSVPPYQQQQESPFQREAFGTDKSTLDPAASAVVNVSPGRTQPVTAQQQRIQELESEQQRKLEQLEAEGQRVKALQEEQRQMHLKAEAERERQKQLEETQLKATREAIQLKAQQEMELHVKMLVSDLIEKLAEEELWLDTTSEQQAEAVLDEAMEDHVAEVANQEYSIMCHDQLLLNRYFERWLRHTRRQAEQRRLMQSMPLWMTTDTRAERTAQVLHPSQRENMQLIRRYRYGAPCNFQRLLADYDNQDEATPVDLFQIVAQHMGGGEAELRHGLLTRRKYFKVVLTLPGEMSELHGFESLCSAWLKKHLRQPQPPRPPGSTAYICAIESEVAVCVRKISGVHPKNESGEPYSDEGDNADAIVCFMSCLHLQNTRKRLCCLLNQSTIFRAVPMALVVYDSQFSEAQLADILELDNMCAEGLLSSYRIYGCLERKRNLHFDVMLERALRFVAQKSRSGSSKEQILEMSPLQFWLESLLGEELWHRWEISAATNAPFGNICSMPQHVVALYQEALDRLQSMVDEDFRDEPEFPAELRSFVPPRKFEFAALGLEYFPVDWKNPKRQQELVKFLQALRLPAYDKTPSKTVEELEKWLLNFATACMPHNDERATHAGYHAIKALIEQLNRPDLQQLDLKTRFDFINYLSVVKALALAHISNVMQTYASALPTDVIYRQCVLREYVEQPWWLKCKAVEAVSLHYTPLNAVSHSAMQNHRDLDMSDEQTEESAELSLFNINEIIQNAEKICRKEKERFQPLFKNSKIISDAAQELEDGLYRYEVAKQCGVYDLSHLQLDELESQAADDCSGSQAKKRKYSKTPPTETDAILARAFKLINREKNYRSEPH